MILTGRQIREARELLGWSRAELSFRARLPLAMTEVIEERESTFMPLDGQALAIRRTLEDAGVELTSEDGGSLRVKLRKTDVGGHG